MPKYNNVMTRFFDILFSLIANDAVSDYDDMFVASKSVTEKQIQSAKYIV